MSIFHSIYQGIEDVCYIWRQEVKRIIKDEGVLIFFFLVPLAYPLLYSWIYNNEAVHEVPVCVVDQSHSFLSRQFLRQCDASPDVRIAYYAQDMDEAKSLVSRQLVKGVYLIPSDFAEKVNRMEQGVISVYCDMSLMLTYKAIFQTAQTVTMEMGNDIKKKLRGAYTAREEAISTRPLDYDDVAIFNPQGGYGSSVLPAVLMLILQQTLVLGIGLSAGTARERNRHRDLIPVSRHYNGIFRIVIGKSMCYFMIYAVMATYMTLCVPRFFGFTQMIHLADLFGLLLPYLLACIFFGMMLSCLVRYRENVMLLVVFTSVPMLFVTGISWPLSNIPGYLQGISWLVPSTFGIRGFLTLNSMGGHLNDIRPEYQALWIQALVYFLVACLVYRYQIIQARKHLLQEKRNILRSQRR